MGGELVHSEEHNVIGICTECAAKRTALMQEQLPEILKLITPQHTVYAKLAFTDDTTDEKEHMWAKVTNRCHEDNIEAWEGILYNDPVVLKLWHCGDWVGFNISKIEEIGLAIGNTFKIYPEGGITHVCTGDC